MATGAAFRSGLNVARMVIDAAQSLLPGAEPEEGFGIELESGDTLTTESGDHIEQEEAP